MTEKLEKKYAYDYMFELFSGARAGNAYNKRLRDKAKLIGIEGEKKHLDIIRKINNISPYKVKRDLYTLDYMDLRCEGGFIFDKNGIRNPVISETVANFNYFNKKYSGNNFFYNIVSHEYGHIIFDEFLFPQIEKISKVFFLPNEKRRQTEAFAFSFGDLISGINMKKSQMDRYKCSENGNLFEAYSSLIQLNKISNYFNPHKLLKIFLDTK